MKSHQSHEEHEEGEEWLMSYADLITVLLAVFVLLFSMSSVDSGKAIKVTTAISKYLLTKKIDENVQADITIVDRNMQALRLLTTFLDLGNPDDLLERLLAMVEKPADIDRLHSLAERMGVLGNAKLEKPTLNFELEIPAKLLYENDSPYLSDNGIKVVQGMASTLKNALSDGSRVLEIVGHTDSEPLPPNSPFSSNKILSAARAEAVSLILQRESVPANRITIIGKGDTEPLYLEKGPSGQIDLEARARNRRVTMILRTIERQ